MKTTVGMLIPPPFFSFPGICLHSWSRAGELKTDDKLSVLLQSSFAGEMKVDVTHVNMQEEKKNFASNKLGKRLINVISVIIILI